MSRTLASIVEFFAVSDPAFVTFILDNLIAGSGFERSGMNLSRFTTMPGHKLRAVQQVRLHAG
jgi:hypothetical protein